MEQELETAQHFLTPVKNRNKNHQALGSGCDNNLKNILT